MTFTHLARTMTALCLLIFGGCARESAARCDLIAAQAGHFTSAEAEDLVEARSFGADCGAATVVLTLRTHEGLPVFAWAAPLYPTFGDGYAPRAAGVSVDAVREFLDRWARAEFSTAQSAPTWSEEVTTPLPQATYEDVRARNAPMACFLSGVARQTCIYWESAAASAAVLLERDVSAAPAK